MLQNLMQYTLERLATSAIDYKQIECYEGQFDSPEANVITLPAAHVEIAAGSVSQAANNARDCDLKIYISTEHIKAELPGAMLDAIDNAIAIFDDHHMHTDNLLGSYEFVGFSRLINFKGFIAYEVSFTFTSL